MVTKSRQLAVCKIQKFGNIKVTAAARCAETACRAGGAVTCWGAVLCRSPAFRTSGHFVPKVGGWTTTKECAILENIHSKN